MWHVFSITFLDCQRYLRDWTLTLAIGTWAKDWNCQAMRLCPAGQWRKNGAVLQEDALSTGIAFRALKCQFVELLWLLSSVGAVRPRMFLWNINRLWAQSTVCLGMWSTTLWTWWCAKFTDYDYAVWAFSSAWIQQCFTDIFPHFHPPQWLETKPTFSRGAAHAGRCGFLENFPAAFGEGLHGYGTLMNTHHFCSHSRGKHQFSRSTVWYVSYYSLPQLLLEMTTAPHQKQF